MWRATIERKEEEPIHIYSGTEIRVSLFEVTGVAVIKGEWDTIVVPLDDMAQIHLYEQGVLTS